MIVGGVRPAVENDVSGDTLSAVRFCTAHRASGAQARAVAMLSLAAEMCDDDARLQRIVPYLLVSPLSPLGVWSRVACSLQADKLVSVDV